MHKCFLALLVLCCIAIPLSGMPTAAGEGHDDVRVFEESEMGAARPAGRGPASIGGVWANAKGFEAIVGKYADVSYHFSGYMDPASGAYRVHAFSIGVKSGRRVDYEPFLLTAGEDGMTPALGCGGFVALVLAEMRYGPSWRSELRKKVPFETKGGTERRYLHQLPGKGIAAAMGLPEAGVMTLSGGAPKLASGQWRDMEEGLYMFAASKGPAGHVGFVRLTMERGKPAFEQWQVSGQAAGRPRRTIPFSWSRTVPGKVNEKSVIVWVNCRELDAAAVAKAGGTVALAAKGGKTEITVSGLPLVLSGGLATGDFLGWWKNSMYDDGKVFLYKVPGAR